MKTITTVVLMIIVTLVFCLAITPSANAASEEEEISQVATKFVKAFNTGDLDLMCSLHWHSPKTTKFTPSEGGAFLTQGWEAIEEGWKETLNPEYPEGSYNGSSHNTQVTILEDNMAIITGYMILTINPPAATEQITELMRQTLVVQKTAGKWLIVHEHTSRLPVE